MLDLSFVRDMVEDCYASSGRPSVDPVLFFRLRLVMFFEDIRSERRLMGVAADRLVSTTEPDGTPMRLSKGQTRPGYQAPYDVVDGGKGRVILNVLVTPSELSENHPMLDLLFIRGPPSDGACGPITSPATLSTAPQRTLRLSGRRTSGHLWRCTRAGAGPTSLRLGGVAQKLAIWG